LVNVLLRELDLEQWNPIARVDCTYLWQLGDGRVANLRLGYDSNLVTSWDSFF